MITPYPHQTDLIDETSDAFRRHQSVMMHGPTGIGKTNMAAMIILRAMKRGKRITLAVHRGNLLHQTARTFKEFGIPFGYIAAGMSVEKRKTVHLASIQTLARRLEKLPVPDLFIVDEAHLAAAKTWASAVDYYRARGSKILGLSGSPTRLDGKPLSNLFDTIVTGPSVRWLIDNGYLSDYVAYCPTATRQVDLSQVHTLAGDYNKAELGDAIERSSIVGDGPDLYRKHAMGTRAVCYCASIKLSVQSCEAFNVAGIPAAHIDGGTGSEEQRRIIRDFAGGKYLVLCNVELITTGFDLSAQVGRDVPIETIIVQRHTKSTALHLQMLGRGLRRKPAPAVFIDQVGNIARSVGGALDVNLGFPDDEREWSLEGKPKSRKSALPAAPVRQCEQCYSVHRPAPACPSCGFVYEVRSREIGQVDGDLERVSRSDVVARPAPSPAKREQSAPSPAKREQSAARSLEDLVEIGRRRGYKNPAAWASHVWGARQQRASGSRGNRFADAINGASG